jgi:outer membrane protein
MMRLFTIITTLIVCVFFPTVQAQILDDMLGAVTDSISDITEEVVPGVTDIRLGAGPSYGPDYEGSIDYELSVAPLVSLQYKDIVQVVNNQVRVTILGSDSIIQSDKFKAGPSLSLDFGRSEKNNIDLTGMGNVGTSVELGAFVSYQEGPMRLRVRARQDVASGHSGMKIISDFRVLFYKNEKMTVISTISGTWVDSDYMNSYFGVNAAQSAASALPVYLPSSSFKDMSINVSTNYKLTDRWSILASGSYKKLTGDAKDSPIVSLRGSSDQLFGGAFVIWTF